MRGRECRAIHIPPVSLRAVHGDKAGALEAVDGLVDRPHRAESRALCESLLGRERVAAVPVPVGRERMPDELRGAIEVAVAERVAPLSEKRAGAGAVRAGRSLQTLNCSCLTSPGPG